MKTSSLTTLKIKPRNLNEIRNLRAWIRLLRWIQASSDTVKSEGWQMKQYWIKYIQKKLLGNRSFSSTCVLTLKRDVQKVKIQVNPFLFCFSFKLIHLFVLLQNDYNKLLYRFFWFKCHYIVKEIYVESLPFYALFILCILINSALLYLKKSWDIHPDCPAPISPKQRVPVIRILVEFLHFPRSLDYIRIAEEETADICLCLFLVSPPSPPSPSGAPCQHSANVSHLLYVTVSRAPNGGKGLCNREKKSRQEP